MNKLPTKILMVESHFYEEITESLVYGACAILEAANQTVERIAVPGVFEIPSAIKFAWDGQTFKGCVTLGCVIRGETDHYNHICREVCRALMDFSIENEMPHGFGILTCENRDQAWERADINQQNKGAQAAMACLRMIEIKTTKFA